MSNLIHIHDKRTWPSWLVEMHAMDAVCYRCYKHEAAKPDGGSTEEWLLLLIRNLYESHKAQKAQILKQAQEASKPIVPYTD